LNVLLVSILSRPNLDDFCKLILSFALPRQRHHQAVALQCSFVYDLFLQGRIVLVAGLIFVSITLPTHLLKMLAFALAATSSTPSSLLIHAQFN